jgi:SPP1 gp7 family putative phage head morphogenesis protein
MARSWDLSPGAELDEAITWLKGRVAVSPEEMLALRENARRTAFWMASVATHQRAARIQASLEDALAHGMTFETWKKVNRSKLRGIPDGHLQTTFRNWVQTSYNAARVNYLSNPQVKRRRPYWVFDAMLDTRTTPVCTAYDGTVLPADHRWWRTHIPPLHHNCRSTVRGLTKRQAERLGIRKRAPSGKLTNRQLERTGSDLDPQAVSPGDGFGSHVREQWQPTTRDIPDGFKPPPRPVKM